MFNKNHQLSVVHFGMILVLLMGMLGVTPARPALADTLTVTTTLDSGPGSLRQAIADAPSGDTIAFDPSLAGQTITLDSNLVINKSLTIDGSGLFPQVTISGGNVAHLEVDAVYAIVTIADLTIADGYTSGNGGAISIAINSRLIVVNSTFRNNHAAGNGGAVFGDGIASLTIQNTTVYQNQAESDGGAFAFIGNASGIDIVNSTVSQNQAGSRGGSIYMAGNTQAAVYNSTFAGNSAPEGGELWLDGSAALYLSNAVFVCVSGDSNCYVQNALAEIHSMSSVLGEGTLFDYGLEELADNGGPTWTMALLPESSLIDAGNDTMCSGPLMNHQDQRGVTRPQGEHCDIGAYEIEDAVRPIVVSFDPANETLNVPLDQTITIQFSEEVDPATVTDTSVFLMPFNGIESVPSAISTTGSVVTLTPNDPLAIGTNYWIQATNAVTDLAGNSLAQTRISFFTTGPNGIMDTTTADFAAANPDSCYVANIENGEVMELPVLGEEFAGARLPVGWTELPLDGGTALISDDKISVDGALAYYSTPLTVGHRLQFAATFSVDLSQEIGLISNPDFSGQWAVFGTNYTPGKLFAMTSDGQSTLIRGNFIGTKHIYEIDWRADTITFYVDGLPVATHTVALTDLRPMLDDKNLNGQALSVEWMHLSPYSSPCTFTSRVFDAGQAVDWLNLGWRTAGSQGTACVAGSPSGSPICIPDYGFTIETRTGNTVAPNETWSSWQTTDFAIPSPDGRYLQYRATLSSDVPSATLRLYSVVATYSTKIHYVKRDATGANNGSSWDDAYIDMQSALAAASSGDQVWVAAGTYKPTMGTDRTVSFILKNGVAIYGGFAGTEMTLDQRDPTANLTVLSGDIDNNDSQTPIITDLTTVTGNTTNSYHVVVGSGTDTSAILDGFTITAGNANRIQLDPGGGVFNDRGSPTITNVILRGNAAGWGGGMYNGDSAISPTGSHPVITNVVFDGNSAREGGGMKNDSHSSPSLTHVIFRENRSVPARAGGGMSNSESNPVLTDVTFDSNTAGVGGGMANIMSNPHLTDVMFNNNSAEWGGGMANGHSSPVITNTTFQENQATVSFGGGISNEGYSHPDLTNVTFNGNQAATLGGGIYIDSSAALDVSNGTFYNNTASGSGGGIYNNGVLNATSSTFSKNSSTQLGGGIYNGGTLNYSNTILAHPSSGHACYNTGTIATDMNNLVEATHSCGFHELGIDPELGPLSDNGGSTLTMALLPGSPAIDAGDNDTCTDTDQRGVARPQGSRCDIGAYEVEYLTISGNAGVSEAIVKYGYGLYTDADPNGNYSIRVLPGWTGTIIPSKPGYSFTPAKMDYTDIQVNQTNQDYTAAANTYNSSSHPGDTWRVSVTNGGAQADDDSFDPVVSADGRYVAYWSFAWNLVPENGATDVLVYDNQTGQTTVVSVDSDGIPLDCNSYSPSISGDGRYVAFYSCAGGGGLNWVVYVYDRYTGRLESIGHGIRPAISADGRYVAYVTDERYTTMKDRIFVTDLLRNEDIQVSISLTGGEPDGVSYFPSLSTDGRYVAFQSSATNLVDGDTNGVEDIFVRDIQTGMTRRVSISSGGLQANGSSFLPTISGDGRYVAFHSTARNLVSGDTNGKEDVFVHDLQTGQTSRVSVSSSGVQGNRTSNQAHISADGRHVAFRSSATNLISGDTNRVADVFLYDRQTGKTKRVSVTSNGTQANGDSSASYSSGLGISADGKYVVFSSDAMNLVAGDTNEYSDIFVHDTSNLSPVILSTPPNGEMLLHRRPTFDWESVSGATTYQIVASQSSSFSTLLWRVNTTDSTYTPPADLPAGKVTYWRVRAQVNGVWSPWSETWSFRTAKPPSIPVLVSPAHKAIIRDYTPLLNWNNSSIPSGGAAFDYYQIQVATDKTFPDPVLIDAVTASRNFNASFYTIGTDLTPNRRYFWRVRAFNVDGEYSSWSTVWNFSTALPPPGNLTPTGGEVVPMRKPLLDWDAVEGATGYDLQISTSDSFVTLLVNTPVTADTFTPSIRLPANKIIYWRVRATGTNGPSRWTTDFFHTP